MTPADINAVAPLKRLDGEAAFDEPWQAQVLAMVDSLIAQDVISATQWSEAFGDALKSAESNEAPDTIDTYYNAALQTLEQLLEQSRKISAADLSSRRDKWEQAYLTTPHGQPVELE